MVKMVRKNMMVRAVWMVIEISGWLGWPGWL
jgi:hypothetical protein